MEKRTNYEKFIIDDFNIIADEFNKKGYSVRDTTDFETYKGWMEQGRKVKTGNRGLKFESSKPYAKPFYHYNSPMTDDKGRRVYRYCKKTFVLFHKEQTECINA
tara:strand:+ start:202 stop:513 length:312 start_codon:yes stop_codon:yes gene_type:complete